MSTEALRLALCSAIVGSNDLRRAPWHGMNNPLAGHCYTASEAAYYLFAGALGFRPATVRHEGTVHWYLVDDSGVVLDLTAAQFSTPVPYKLGRRRGFLTKRASKRGRELMRRAHEHHRADILLAALKASEAAERNR